MKMKLWTLLAALATLFIVSCSDDYDDTAIKGQINDLENRVTALEQLCQQMNTNISSLQTIVNALQEHDYITSVTPIKEGNAVIGYTINFAKNDPITIYHGKDGANGANGADGYVPQIGVAKYETDGLYYWTLDGEWLTDAEGNMVRAQGIDGGSGEGGAEGSTGKDGITPLLKIKLNHWYISYDNGATWERLGPATGSDGSDGADGDSWFDGVDVDENFITFYLTNGTTFKVPTWDAFTSLQQQVETIQELVEALEEHWFIVNVKEFSDNIGSGWEIVMVKGQETKTIYLYHGNTPVIGITYIEGSDEETQKDYYWTVNGELLLVDGKPVPATGNQGPAGEQGPTPKFKIENGYLWVSFGDTDGDGKDDWTQVGEIASNCDCPEIKIDQNDEGYVITIGDTGITIPKFDPMTVSIAEGETAVAEPGTVKTLNVTFTGNPTIKTVICNWPAKIENWNETEKTAEVKVTVPKSTTAGDSEAVTILVSDGSHTAMNTITLVVTKKTTYKVGDIYEVTITDGTTKKAVVISINNPDENGFGTSGKVMAIEEWVHSEGDDSFINKWVNNGGVWSQGGGAKEKYAHYGSGWTMPYKTDWEAIINSYQAIQNALEANEGAKIADNRKYWANDHVGSGQCPIMTFSGGAMSESTGSTSHKASVRAVLAVSEF